MIQTPTVLVLGAGASMPYGFPSGKQLKERILSFGRAVQSDVRAHPEQFELFREELRRSQRQSVDAFLERRPNFMNLGKALIARGLMVNENINLILDKDDWYQFLWEQMDTRFDEFHKNEVSFITFNYDRSLEEFLFTALKSTHGVSEQDAAAKLRQIPVVHVYGQLGLLEWQAGEDEKADIRPYDSANTSQEAVKVAARGIQILTEGQADSDKFREAHGLLHTAERIYFLGFGYNEVNMKRLHLPVNGSEYYVRRREMAGSCFRLTEAEREFIQVMYQGLQLGSIHHSALEFLRNDSSFLRVTLPPTTTGQSAR